MRTVEGLRSILLLFSFLSHLRGEHIVDVVSYLQSYGYLTASTDKSANVTASELKNSLTLFQEYNNISVTGDVNDETIAIMNRPRCGNEDDLYPFMITNTRKWNNKNLTWYTFGNEIPIDIAGKAFDVWANQTDITFTRSRNEPNIIISYGSINHTCISKRRYCTTPFKEGVMAHAFSPYEGVKTVEIHINSHYNWLRTMEIPDYDHDSLFIVLVHEIGHALGLSHESDPDSVMFFMYGRIPSDIKDLNYFELHQTDVWKIQSLYGNKSVSNLLPSPTSTTIGPTETTLIPIETTIKTTTTSKPIETTNEPTTSDVKNQMKYRDICMYKNEINQILIIDKFVYFLMNKLVWKIHLVETMRSLHELIQPFNIIHWLHWIPLNFGAVTAVYQTRNGNVELFTHNTSYSFSYPDLRLIETKTLRDSIQNVHVSSVTGAYINFLGQGVLLTEEGILLQIEDCTGRYRMRGFTRDAYNINPWSVSSLLRFTNSKLYFFHKTDKYLIEYDEYLKTVTGIVNNPLLLFNITCVEDTIVKKLYDLTSNLLLLKSN